MINSPAYDLATQCESRRASIRRHTIVGCQSFKSLNDSQSVPPSRPSSRQTDNANSQPPSMTASMSTVKASATPQQTSQNPTTSVASNLNSMDAWIKNSLDESEWKERLQNDRLSLTLEEIVHIRSVITKAELESLPMGIQIKEDVEKRKLCFLCLRTKFGVFTQRGVPCKLCQRTVCSKCYMKMRIPTEHFSNVPVQLLSPSRQNSPSISNAPSPSHHAIDESFPRSLMERLLRTDVDRKVRAWNFFLSSVNLRFNFFKMIFMWDLRSFWGFWENKTRDEIFLKNIFLWIFLLGIFKNENFCLKIIELNFLLLNF